MTITQFKTELRAVVQKAGDGDSPPVHLPRRMRAIGYVRQGFGEMDKKWTSCEGQKARIAACADANDWHLTHIFEDIGWSGEDLDRPPCRRCWRRWTSRS